MKRRVILSSALVSWVLLSFLALRLLPATAQTAPGPVPVDFSKSASTEISYQQVQPALGKAKSLGMPVRVPRLLVYHQGAQLSTLPFAVGGADDSGYGFSIVTSRDCQGGLGCSIAYADARRLTSRDPAIEDSFAAMRDPGYLSRLKNWGRYGFEWVKLSNGRSVYIVPWVLQSFGGMRYAQAVWDEGGYRYTIALKGGDKDWLLQMANSAFE